MAMMRSIHASIGRGGLPLGASRVIPRDLPGPSNPAPRSDAPHAMRGGQPGGQGPEAVRHAAVGIDANAGFHSMKPVVALHCRCHIGITRPALFFAGDGASMIVASTIVPARSVIPLSPR